MTGSLAGLVPQDALQTEETFRFLSAPPAWVIALLIVPAVALFVWWSYGGMQRLEPRARWLLSALRGGAIALCLLALFQPAFERVRYATTRDQIHVLVDDSASMQRKDAYPDAAQRESLTTAAGPGELAATTRSELVRKVLERPGGLLDRLRGNQDVRLFRFMRKPLPVQDLGELTARGTRTQIGDALDLHLGASGAVNLDAVILVSDGRNNAGLDPTDVARKYALADVPIFTLGVGDPNAPRNVRIVGPSEPREALRKEEVAFDVTVSAEGLAGRQVTVTLTGIRDGESPRLLASAGTVLAADGEPVRVRLLHAFEDPGDWSLVFEVSGFPEETTTEDNTDRRFLRVEDQKIRVLYLEDMARFDYRYLKAALQRVDPSIEAQIFMFDASRDFVQEHSEGLTPLRDIPRTREEFQKYHVILLGDIPPERIAPTEALRNEWLQLLVEFVELGGGVGMQFGEGAMPEAWRGTVIEDLLPVELEDPVTLQANPVDRISGYTPQLETPYAPHETVMLKRDPLGNAKLWHEGFDQMVLYYPVKQAKAGAEVVLRHPTDSNRYGKRVLMAAGYYPRGRTLFLATDQIWKLRNPYAERYYDSFWRNVVRWLAQGKLRRRDDRVDLRLDKVIVDAGERVRVTMELRDDELQPVQSREAVVFLRRADGEIDRRTLNVQPDEPGTFEGTFTLDEPGTISVLVCAGDDPGGRILAREEVLVKFPDREFALSSQDVETLTAIATSSDGGRYFFLGEADRLAEVFADRKPYQNEVGRETRPAWDNLWTLLAILGLLGVEWTLRKRARLV